MSTDSARGTGGGRNFGLRVDGITDTFYPVYEFLFDGDSKFETDLERKLAEAQMGRNVEMYLTWALGVGLLSGFVLFAVGLFLSYLLFGTGIVHVDSLIGLRLPDGPLQQLARLARGAFLVVGGGLLVGSIGFGSAFGFFVALPYSRSAQRRREMNLLLPDAISFMYALSVGGMNQLEILESMAKADDTYGEVSHEFQSIIKEAEYFDTDYRTAIQKRADETPSNEFGQFLTDMLSIIDSGGNLTDFLADKKELHFQTAKEEQERILDTLELFTEIYITLSLFPLLLIVILVIMSLMGQANDLLLYGTVYGMIPLTGAAFIVLVSTVRQDEFGDGYLKPDDSAGQFDGDATAGPLNLGLITEYVGTHYVFDRIKNREATNETLELIRQPHRFFKSNPLYSLAVTVPAAVAVVAVAVSFEVVPVTWQGALDAPLRSTVVYAYVPLFLTCVPLAVFWEWNVRSRREILDNLSATLRKLSNANATGLTLLESVRLVGETSPGRLGDEFGTMYVKSRYGMLRRRLRPADDGPVPGPGTARGQRTRGEFADGGPPRRTRAAGGSQHDVYDRVAHRGRRSTGVLPGHDRPGSRTRRGRIVLRDQRDARAERDGRLRPGDPL
ncbi:MAG: type II secretion system F family protein [Halosimplex sp.]